MTMPYVGRDASGTIVVVSTEQRPGVEEVIAADAPELQDYLACLSDGPADDLARSDQDLIRVVEDIVDMLIEKNVIRFTDLPQAAQHKLLHRRSLRRSRAALDLLGDPGQQAPPVIKL
jgi:hypothetical protein